MNLLRASLERELRPRLLVLIAAVYAVVVVQTRPRGELEALFAEPRPATPRAWGWSLALLLVLPYFVLRAAGGIQRWRDRDADWFAPLPCSRSRFARAAIAGPWLAGSLVFAAAIGLAELRAPGGPALRRVCTLATPAAVLLDAEQVRWEQSDLDLGELLPGSVLVLEPTITLGAGPVAEVRATLAGEGFTPVTAEALLHGRHRIELPVPEGARGTARLTLERLGPGATLVLPASALEVLEPVGSARLGTLELAGAALLATLAWCSLAAGLGAWMRPGVAVALTLVVALAPFGSNARWLPGHGLYAALAAAGDGLLAARPGPGEVLVALAVALVGTSSFTRGLARGRSA